MGTNGSQALDIIGRKPPNLLILDHVLSDGELGLDFLPEFKELVPFVPIIVVSGALEVHDQIQALQGPRRAHYCIPKPVDIEDLPATPGEDEEATGPRAGRRGQVPDLSSLLADAVFLGDHEYGVEVVAPDDLLPLQPEDQ